MAPVDLKKVIVSWLQMVEKDKNIKTRHFMNIDELYDLYCSTFKGMKIESLSSFSRIINAIVHNSLYLNLKSKRSKGTTE